MLIKAALQVFRCPDVKGWHMSVSPEVDAGVELPSRPCEQVHRPVACYSGWHGSAQVECWMCSRARWMSNSCDVA